MFPLTITYYTPACIGFSSSYENTHLKMQFSLYSSDWNNYILNDNGKIFKLLNRKENKGRDPINVLSKIRCTSKLGPGIFIRTLLSIFKRTVC